MGVVLPFHQRLPALPDAAERGAALHSAMLDVIASGDPLTAERILRLAGDPSSFEDLDAANIEGTHS